MCRARSTWSVVGRERASSRTSIALATRGLVGGVSRLIIATAAVLAYVGAATASPVLHWRLDGNMLNSGTGGSQYDGVLVQGTTGGFEYIGGAHALTQQGLSLTNLRVSSGGTYVSSAYVPKDSGTIALWYKPGQYYDHNTVFNNSVSADDWEMWIPASGTATARINKDGTARLQYSLNQPGWTPNDWYHLAITWERDPAVPTSVNSKLYVNGELRQDMNGNWIAPGNFLLGGRASGNMYGDGVWDDVRIYERALGGQEVFSLSRAATQPVVHWNLDGNLLNSGTGGSQYNGTLVVGAQGSSAYAAGAYGTSMGLDLDSNGIRSTGGAHVSSTYTLPNSGTVALWYKPGSFYNYNSIFDNSIHGDRWEFWIYENGQARFRAGDASAMVAYSLPNLGTAEDWYHLAVSWEDLPPADPGNPASPERVALRLFVDGQLRQSYTGDKTAGWVNPGYFLLGGGHSGNNYGNGIWDDVRIFDRPLSAHEIVSLMIPEPSVPAMLALAVPLWTLRRRRHFSRGTHGS